MESHSQVRFGKFRTFRCRCCLFESRVFPRARPGNPRIRKARSVLEHLVLMTIGARTVGQRDALLTHAEKNLHRITDHAAEALALPRASQRLQSNQFKAGIISEAKKAIAAAGTSKAELDQLQGPVGTHFETSAVDPPPKNRTLFAMPSHAGSRSFRRAARSRYPVLQRSQAAHTNRSFGTSDDTSHFGSYIRIRALGGRCG